MRYSFYRIIIIFVSFLIGVSCPSYKNLESAQRQNYSCQNYKLSARMENVDAETNGEKSGDTHFHSPVGAEVFFSYELADSTQKALEKIKIETDKAKFIVRKSELKDAQGQKLGEIVIFFSETKLQISETIEKKYNLLWTNEAIIYSVSSESLSAIEIIEKDCNFN